MGVVAEERRVSDTSDKESEGGYLLDFYRQNGIDWGAADLFLVGEPHLVDRVAEFIALLRAIRDTNGRPVFRTIEVILPPFEEEPRAYLDRLKSAFSDTVR